MSMYSTILATSLLGLSYLIVPPAVLGQSSTSDTTPADTQRTRADSAWVSGVYHAPDTTQRDTASAGDTTRADSDTLPGGAADTMPASLDTSRTVGADSVRDTANTVGRDTSTVGASDTARARRTDTASASAAPADSILSAACDGVAGASSIARDLLVIVFAPKTNARERAAVARLVGGKLLGRVMGEPGAYYLGLPPGSEEPALRAAADRLIRRAQVRQVGSRSCPSATGT